MDTNFWISGRNKDTVTKWFKQLRQVLKPNFRHELFLLIKKNLLKALKVAEKHSPHTKIKLLSNNAGKILSTTIKYEHYISETLFLSSGLNQNHVQIK